jgi:SagB-type dehydrogenase family enzyme
LTFVGARSISCYRRAGSLVAWFDEDELVLENYLTGHQTVVHPHLLPILGSLTAALPEPELLATLGGESSRPVFEELVKQRVLLEAGSVDEVRDRSLDQHWAWGQDARYFHYSTARTKFDYDLQKERHDLVMLAGAEPQPPPFKDYGQDDELLPDVELKHVDLWDVLSRRRTGRAFSSSQVGRDELATILHWTWGVRELRKDPGVGVVALKTSPSGGARHPVEVYPVVLRVEGIQQGVYHYCAGRNSLHLIRGGDYSREVLAACTFQPWVVDAAVVFIMTGVVERIAWKYKQSHAYRVLLLDAGHTGQSFHLACTGLGLLPWTSAALNESAAGELIGVDGLAEIVLYAAACGKPPEQIVSK